MHVHIRGDGLAAWCCARLLAGAGFRVTVEGAARRSSRLILVNGPTQKLLNEFAGDSTIFENAMQIQKRVVAWGPGAVPRTFDHSAAAIREASLLDTLWARESFDEGPDGADRTIITAPPAPVEELGFGSRKAWIAQVDVDASVGTCWTESVEAGWLFLIGGPAPVGFLIAVGAAPDALLRSSRVISEQVANVRNIDGPVRAYPRIASEVSQGTWLACGTAAMALDPLCGDGAGHAIREAILAVSVLRAIAAGSEPGDVLEHYQARLRAAFERHLKLCEAFYVSGGDGEWWLNELALLREGLAWCRARPTLEWRYRLQGFDLLRLGA
jgi:hypothetical protein